MVKNPPAVQENGEFVSRKADIAREEVTFSSNAHSRTRPGTMGPWGHSADIDFAKNVSMVN